MSDAMQQQQEPVQVTLNDIATVVQIIDVVSRRGGFQGQELAGVGMLRNKLDMFLQQNMSEEQKQQLAAAQDNQQADTPVDVTSAEGELASLVQ